MPVNLDRVDDIANVVAQIYREGETAILRTITDRLATGLDRTDWQTSRLAAINALRRSAQTTATALQFTGDREIRAAVAAGYRSGSADAVHELAALVSPSSRGAATLPGGAARRNANAVQALADATVGEVRPLYSAILPQAEDLYRRTIAGAAARRLTGAADWRTAAQAAYATLVRNGVTGYTDSAGRRWSLSTYVEMSVRTAVQRAAVHGLVDEFTASGVRLVSVDDLPGECPLCRPYEHQVLALTGAAGPQWLDDAANPGAVVEVDVKATLTEAMAAGLFHPHCFPGEVMVSAPSGVRAADSRWYEGELVVIHTAGGDELPVTPNHPVLTPEGWIPAGAVEVGGHVLRYQGGAERVDGARPRDEQIPARIGEVFDALRESSPVAAVRVPAAAEQFHGDGMGSDVEVVFTDGLLSDAVDAQLGERFHDGSFVVGASGLGSLAADRGIDHGLLGLRRAPHGGVGGSGQLGALCRRHARETARHGLAPADRLHAAPGQGGRDYRLRVAEAFAYLALIEALAVQADGLVDPGARSLRRDAGGAQFPVEGPSVDADGGRDLAGRLAGRVSADRVVKVERRQWAGHVYNLQTGDGWYVAGGIVVHNCRHTIRAYVPGVSLLIKQGRTADPRGAADRDRQRAIERTIRYWRQMEAAALDDAARRAAAAKVAQWDAAMTEHIRATGLTRIRVRETIGAGIIPPPGRVDDLAGQLGIPTQPALDLF